MVRKDCQLDVVSFSTMINGYGKAKNLDQAFNLFQEMSCKAVTPNDVTCNTQIDNLCKDSRLHQALHLFDEMRA